MSKRETKFRGSWNFDVSVFLYKLHVLHFKNSYVIGVAEYLRTGRNCIHAQYISFFLN